MLITNKGITLSARITLLSKRFLLFVMGLYLIVPAISAVPMGGPPHPIDVDTGVSDTDFETALANEIETICSNPEKRAQFEETVKEMEKAIEAVGGEEAFLNMSEEDMTNFLTNFAEEQEKKQKTKTEQPKPAPKPKAPETTITLTGKELLLDNIKAIIKYIDSFFAKVPAMPELPEKIEKWSKRGTLSEWGADAKWNTVKKNIELLQSKLNTIIAVSKGTEAKKYVDYVFEDESLKNHLQLLKIKLADSEPLINVATFGLTKLGAESKKATQKTLSCLGEAIQKLKIIDAINKAIEKYDPIAKELREKEEQLQKAAEQESKKKPTPSRTAQVRAPKSDRSSKRKVDDSYWPSPSSSSYYDDSYSRAPYYSDSYTPSRKKSSYASEPSSSKAVGSENKKTPKTEAKKDDKKEEKKTAPSEHDIKLKKYVNTFEEEIEAIINESTNKEKFKTATILGHLDQLKKSETPTRFSPELRESLGRY